MYPPSVPWCQMLEVVSPSLQIFSRCSKISLQFLFLLESSSSLAGLLFFLLLSRYFLTIFWFLLVAILFPAVPTFYCRILRHTNVFPLSFCAPHCTYCFVCLHYCGIMSSLYQVLYYFLHLQLILFTFSLSIRFSILVPNFSIACGSNQVMVCIVFCSSVASYSSYIILQHIPPIESELA